MCPAWELNPKDYSQQVNEAGRGRNMYCMCILTRKSFPSDVKMKVCFWLPQIDNFPFLLKGCSLDNEDMDHFMFRSVATRTLFHAIIIYSQSYIADEKESVSAAQQLFLIMRTDIATVLQLIKGYKVENMF